MSDRGRFVQAVLMLSGMIIGVGMFAIPFSFSASGFLLGTIELLILAIVVLAIHRSYGEIVLHSREQHRLPGYARLYIGKHAALLANASALFGISGTLLAYVLLGGVFLDNLLKEYMSGSYPVWWSIMFVIGGIAITFFPLKKKTILTSFLTALLIVFLCILIGLLLPRIHIDSLKGFNVAHAFAPYGVLLFALSGATVIPDVVMYYKGSKARTRSIITIGSLLPAVFYFLFALAVVGASGKHVSPDAISGLRPIAGTGIMQLGNLMGLIAVSTAYLLLNSSFQAFLMLDLKVSRSLSWAGASFIPLVLFLLGFQNFISVISVVGATTVAIDGGIIIAIYHIILHRHERTITRSDTIRFGAMYVMIILGIGYEFYRFIVAYVV